MPFTAPQEHKRYILHNKKLMELPSKLSQIIKKVPPFQQRLIKYLIHDLGTKKLDLEQHGGDISIYDFMTYRFGEDIAKYFFDPMCRGITAGDSKKLSMISVFPDTFRGEQTHGSVIKGTFGPKNDHNNYMDSELVRFAVEQKWSVWTFKQGLQYLPDGLCNYMVNIQDNPIEIYNESKVERLDFDSKPNIASVYIKNSDNEEIIIEADFVFSALPSRSLGKILSATKYPKLCKVLNEISSANVAVVNLEFNGKLLTNNPGFGFLAPSSEQSKILGVVFDSHTFPNFDADKDITRLTVILIL